VPVPHVPLPHSLLLQTFISAGGGAHANPPRLLPLASAAMSDVPLAAKTLQCLICNFVTNSRAALQWHGMSSHAEAGRARRQRRKQPGGPSGPRAGPGGLNGDAVLRLHEGSTAAGAGGVIGGGSRPGVGEINPDGGPRVGAACSSAGPPSLAVQADAATSWAATPAPPVGVPTCTATVGAFESGATASCAGDVMRAQAAAVRAEMDQLMSAPVGEPDEADEVPSDNNGAGQGLVHDDGHGVTKAPVDGSARTQALIAELESLLACGKEAKEGPAHKKRKVNNGAVAKAPRSYDYSNLAEHIRTLYEEIKDWQRAEPIISARKRANPGKFDTFRLQALQRFVLRTGRAGLSLREQEDLFDLLDVWDGTRPGMPVDTGHKSKIRDSFRSAYAFQCAMRDDLDAAVVGAGWKTCVLEEGGEKYVAIFRSAMDALLEDLRSGKKVRFWSGGDHPAPPTHMRETPMDGDAFRLSEEEVLKEHADKPGAFMMGIHVYSDSSLLSWSGGMFECLSNGADTVDMQRGESQDRVRTVFRKTAMVAGVALAVAGVAAVLAPFSGM